MRIYNLLSSGLHAVDYAIIAVLGVIAVGLTVLVVWRKLSGKGGCDCGSCSSVNTCKGNCTGCNSCPSKQEENIDENA